MNQESGWQGLQTIDLLYGVDLDFSLGTPISPISSCLSPSTRWGTNINQGLPLTPDISPCDALFGEPLVSPPDESDVSGNTPFPGASPSGLIDPEARDNNFAREPDPSDASSDANSNGVSSQAPRPKPIWLQLTTDRAPARVEGFARQIRLPRRGCVEHHSSRESSRSPSDSAPNIRGGIADERDGLGHRPRRANAQHNSAEKRYRGRISAQFDGLLKVLPSSRAHRSTMRPFSKSMILAQARKRICELEDRVQTLETVQGQLMALLR